MIYKYTLSIVFTGLISFGLIAQSNTETKPLRQGKKDVSVATKSEVLTAEKFKDITTDDDQTLWNTSIVNTGGPNNYSDEMQELKAAKNSLKLTSAVGIGNDRMANRRDNEPVVDKNFEGNELVGGTPPDNTIAASKGGLIISVDNSTIEYYDTNGTVLLSRRKHADFFNDNTLTGKIFDPRVLYDSRVDRFIYVVLHGSSSTTSQVLVSFSKTNDPRDGWHTYKFDGTFLNNGTWLDYPSIGVSTNELYISGNMFKDNGTFDQCVLFQIEKADAYSGNNINFQRWTNIKTPFSQNAFTIKPLSFGHEGSYGPGIYMVSNGPQGSQNGNIYVYDLTDDMSASNEMMLSFDVQITGGYSIGGDSKQKGTTELLKTGGCRIQRGFYLNGLIHFVFTSDFGGGYCGLNYSRVDVANESIVNKTYGLTGYDYAYPSIASLSENTSDKTVAVAFLRSGTDIYPECRVMTFDDDMNASSSVQVKAGQTYVSLINGAERWGDYSCIARRHGANNTELWMAGCYGVADRHQHGYNAWIAQIKPASSALLKPVAIFSATPTTGQKPLMVTFNNTSANNPTSYSWSFPGGIPDTSSLESPTIEYADPGVYDVTLTATNANGSDVEEKKDYITIEDYGVGVGDVKKDEFSISPNPVIDDFKLTFNMSQKEHVIIEILDISGKLVKTLFEDAVKSGTNELTFNKNALSAGTYFIKIRTTEGILKTKKLIIH
jgi:PKD repeat protein